jgi:hypothetical protein
MWAEIGDVNGTDATCTVDTDGNDPAHRDCGRTTSRGPGFTENGSLGNGVWAKSVVNLSTFSGKLARLRWIGMEGGGWSFGVSRSFLEPQTGGTVYQYYDYDDGWWIDDIRLTDLRQAPALITPDDLTGLAVCHTGQYEGNCSLLSPEIAGSTLYPLPTDPNGRRLFLDTPGQPISLDGRRTTGFCDNGMLLYEFSEIDPATGLVREPISPLSPAGEVKVAPVYDTTYRVQVKCSSDLDCAAQRDVLVAVYSGSPGEIDLAVTGGGANPGDTCPASTTATLTWRSRPQPGYLSGYDVFRKGSADGTPIVIDRDFTGVCFAGNIAQPATIGANVTTADATCPAPGQAYFYLVGHSSPDAAQRPPVGVTSTQQGYSALTSCPP